MLTFRDQYRRNITYSQNGEEGILIEIFERLDIKKGVCAEFGAHNGMFCSNTRYFLENGWAGTLIEANPALSLELIDNTRQLRAKVITHTMVTPENVNLLLPSRLDLLSIDCDGPDYAIWKAYTGQAHVVVIEIDSSRPPDSEVIMNEATAYKPMVELGLSKGYMLICHTGNLIFVRNEYADWFPEITADPIIDVDLYFDKSFM